MDQKQVVEIVNEYKKVVLSFAADAKLYLYGSYSKGTARPESDIDVAVVVPQTDDRWTMYARLWRATRKVNTLIEPVLIESQDNSPLYEDVLKTGIAI